MSDMTRRPELLDDVSTYSINIGVIQIFQNLISVLKTSSKVSLVSCLTYALTSDA